MNFAPMVVNVLGIKVNAMDRASNMIFGPTQQLELFQNNKRNLGLGEDNGDFSNYFFPINILSDNDLSDSPAVKNSLI